MWTWVKTAFRVAWPALPPILAFAVAEAVFLKVARIGRLTSLAEPTLWKDATATVAEAATAPVKILPLPAHQAIAGAEALATATAWSAFLALVLVCAGVVMVAVAVLAATFGRKRAPMLVGAVAPLICTALLAAVLYSDTTHTYAFFGEHMFSNTVCRASDVTLGPWSGCSFDAMLITGTMASVIAGFYVVAAVCAVASLPTAASSERLKYLLFSASAVFFFGVFALRAWNSWPAAYYVLPNEKLAKAGYELALQGYVNLQALGYVFVLLALFAPTAYRLRNQAPPAPDAGAPTQLSLWSEGMQKALAILAPLLASPILGLITDMASAGGGK